MVVKFSYLILFVLLFAVILNSVYISSFTKDLYAISAREENDDIEALEKKFKEIKRIYDKNEIFISLTVSHEDLTNIQAILAEIDGALKASDKEAAIIAKSRFESAITHLGQLSAFNMESIF